MPLLIRLITALLLAASTSAAAGDGPVRPGDYYPPDVLDKPLGVERLPNGNTLITDAGGAYYTTTDSAVLEVDPQGKVVWTYSGELRFAHTARLTQAGTILITDTSNNVVIQVNRAGDIVWSSDDWGGGSGRLSDGSHLHYPNNAEELDGGNLLITDRNNDRVIEVTPDGSVVWKYDALVRPHNGHRLANGNTLISDSESNLIIEVDPAGNIVWSFGGSGALSWPRNGERLANGNTLITDSRGGRVLEVDAAGRTVWQYTDLALPFEAHRLANGNTLIADNNRRRVIEVSPDGRIAWQFRNIVENVKDSLANGDFERDANGDGLPDDWYPADLNAEGLGTFIWDGVEHVHGERSASLEYHEQGRLAWLQTVRVEPGGAYHFEGWLKGQIASGAYAIQLWFVDALGGPLGDQPTIVGSQGRSTDWTRVAADVTAPGNADGLQVWILAQADGRVWADDLSLTPADDRSAAAPGLGWAGGLGAAIVIAVVAAVVYSRRTAPGVHVHSNETAARPASGLTMPARLGAAAWVGLAGGTLFGLVEAVLLLEQNISFANREILDMLSGLAFVIALDGLVGAILLTLSIGLLACIPFVRNRFSAIDRCLALCIGVFVAGLSLWLGLDYIGTIGGIITNSRHLMLTAASVAGASALGGVAYWLSAQIVTLQMRPPRTRRLPRRLLVLGTWGAFVVAPIVLQLVLRRA